MKFSLLLQATFPFYMLPKPKERKRNYQMFFASASRIREKNTTRTTLLHPVTTKKIICHVLVCEE